MDYTWEYPIFVVPHGPGYVSFVERRPDAEPACLLAVYTSRRAAAELIVQFELPEHPRALKNAREFRWLLMSLKKPVTEVAFDAAPTDDAVNAQWSAAVSSLLAGYLDFDNSPWNYPVFVIAYRDHFACIEGESNDERSLTAVAIFTTEDKASSYLSAVDEVGTIEALLDVDKTTAFLKSLSTDVAAVAVDPTIAKGRHAARHCFGVATLLDKYLVRTPSSSDSPDTGAGAGQEV